MHDLPSTALTRPDLPIAGVMAKVGCPETIPPATKDASELTREDPALDSEGTSIGSESTTEPNWKRTELHAPQPVTPDTPKAIEETAIHTTKTAQLDADEKKGGEPELVEEQDFPQRSPQPGIDSPSSRLSNTRSHAKASNQGLDPATPSPGGEPTESPAQGSSTASRRSRSNRNSKRYDDDGSSSDDDSYFAKHLPSPKSGRSFSYSSTGSPGAAGAQFYQNHAARESDASLSFSDESDDEMHRKQGALISPNIPPNGTVADMNIYTQRITRMHSVSSLVSSGSSEDGDGENLARRTSASSVSSYTTSGTTSDTGVRAELRDVAAEFRPASNLMEQSGRRSPVVGQFGVPGYFYSSPSTVVSPPAILPEYAVPVGVSHPQPQPMTQDQIAAWFNAGENSASLPYPTGLQTQDYASTEPLGLHQGGFHSYGATSPFPSVPFVYSDDDEPLTNKFVNHLADRNGFQNRQTLPQGSRGGGSGSLPGFEAPASADAENSNDHRSPAQPTTKSGFTTAGQEQRSHKDSSEENERDFKVYWQRWLMLFYMSILNLLSDWTCYSVAPISLLTEEAFGDIDPERLVVVFLGANAIASISEPIILSRLGFRRTVLFGALLLMIGSIVKSGGVPPILQSDITVGNDAWRLYLGFFLVGLSQPLYQCTPTLLSSSWFPEEERTLATGVALNANQLGIGCAFVFGTLLVGVKEDIIPYFGLLSTISTIVFLGALIQFDDAPPTPPSSSARVVRGTLDMKLPSINTIVQSVRGGLTALDDPRRSSGARSNSNTDSSGASSGNPAASGSDPSTRGEVTGKSKRSNRRGNSARRRNAGSRSATASSDNGLMAPSSAMAESTLAVENELSRMKMEAIRIGVMPPSFALPGRVEAETNQRRDSDSSLLYDESQAAQSQPRLNPPAMGEAPMYPGVPGMVPGMPPGMPQGMPPGMPGAMPPGMPGALPPGMPGALPPGMPPGVVPPFGALPHPQYQYPYWDPQFQQHLQQQHAYYQQQFYYQQPLPSQFPPSQPYYYPPMPYPPQYLQGYAYQYADFPATSEIDEGAEPVLTITPHHLDIDVRDDQVIRSLRACFARQGFVHALVAFTASGIVINTLSTYMDYLVRLNGAPSAYTGIVGGTFQFVIMISSLIIGKFTDTSRAYYSVTIAMLVLGAFGLAECGVSLDANRGGDLRVCLVIVAALVGPLQPVSTELGVDVVYPLSENTVLVIQQLFSNLLSAVFIPIFKSLKHVGSGQLDDTEVFERPDYTFSFYLLIVIHTTATVFFATFNGKYLRYEHELQKKAEKEYQEAMEQERREAIHPFFRDQEDHEAAHEGERQPLVSHQVV